LAQIQTPLRDLVEFVPIAGPEGVTPVRQAPERGGFTILVNLGVGIQRLHIAGESDSATGLAGANVGVGGFVNPKLAVLGRFSGTNVIYEGDDFRVIAGVVGATTQIWVHERFAIETGGGLGFVRGAEGNIQETGFGLILGASAVVFRSGKHNLLAGFEYAPVFFNDETDVFFGESFSMHNFGFTFGYQFHVR
jgi:hypothetical protein